MHTHTSSIEQRIAHVSVIGTRKGERAGDRKCHVMKCEDQTTGAAPAFGTLEPP